MKTNFELERIRSLHQKTIFAAHAEKAATYHLLECLHELDRKRAYLDLGYSSLFDYVCRALGYSENQSFERISAMRLAFKVPTVAEKLQSGEISLSVASRVATHAKRERLDAAAIAVLALRLVQKSVRETEKLLAVESTRPVPPREVVRPFAANQSQLNIIIDDEFEALLQEARELDANPTLSRAEILKKALQMYVAEKRKKKGISSAKRPRFDLESRRQDVDSEDREVRSKTNRRSLAEEISSGSVPLPLGTSKVEPVLTQKELSGMRVAPQHGTSKAEPIVAHANSNPKTISKLSRQILWTRSQGKCEYVSPLTHARCSARHAIQIDHRTPKALNGSNNIANLRHLCRQHNLAAARELGVGR